jgi:hypothetical protein
VVLLFDKLYYFSIIFCRIFCIIVNNIEVTTQPLIRGKEPLPTMPPIDCLLTRRLLESEALWQEAKAYMQRDKGLLFLDDTTLDKLYAINAIIRWSWSVIIGVKNIARLSRG